jgi:hypothetical protein
MATSKFLTDISIDGGLTIEGSLSRGTYTSASQYHSGADNIVLKGNASGISSIFFESEKDGTNINHASDFGFIQFHPYGTGSSGESNELIIGVSNDADDHLILNAPNVNGLKFRTGASATDYTIWHSGNFSNNSANWNTAYGWGNHAGLYLGATAKAADSNLLDGIDSGSFLRSDATDTFTGNVLAFPTLSLGIANNNSDNGYGTYFRGSNTHFVLGLSAGNTLYLNYGNSSGTMHTYGNWYHGETQILSAARALTNVTNTNWDTAYGWGNHASAGYLTTVSFSDLTGKPSTLSGYGINDAVSLGADNVFTGDNEFEGDLLRTNQRISSSQEYPLGHYTPGETVFELDPTWSNRELQQYFDSGSVSWDQVANAPGGYAVYINGAVEVGGVYNSGFPYIPIDQDGIYYMEVWIKNAGTAQGHYMGSIDYEADFTHPSSGGGNPGSYGYWVMSNYTGATEWTKRSGYITGHHNNNTGAFETDATYWTPQALFNYTAGTGTRACWISGWKVIRVDHVGNRTFQDNVTVKGKLEVHTLDNNTSSTTALVMNANEVEKRTLGSLAFSSATYDNYGSWNLKTNDVQRTTVGSGGNLNLVAGTNVSLSYSSGGTVTITSTDTNTQLTDAQVRSKISGTGLISYNSTTGVISTTANNYSLPAGSSTTRGGFKIGYAENGKNYPVEVSSEKMYVNVPWTDNNTDTVTSVGVSGSETTGTITLTAAGATTLTQSGQTIEIRSTDTNTTYTVGDGGLTQKNFTTTLKTKLDGIAAGAEVNVQSDWNATSGDALILNKPTIPSGNAIIDWTVDQGSTNIHSGNYSNTQLTDAQVRSKISGTGLIGYNSSTGVISTTANNYVHPTTAGNKHIPSGGAAGQFLKYSSSGTAVWAAPSYTTSLAWTSITGKPTLDNYVDWKLVDGGGSASNVRTANYVKIDGSTINGTGTQADPYVINTQDTNTTYTADGNYGMTLSGTAFRLENDRRRNSSTQDIYTGNTHDYTFYDADIGIRWYTAGAEEMRLEDDGDLHVDGDVIAFSTTVSDARLKDDVQTIENATEKVNQLRGVSYTWNEGSRKGQREIGVIAQEVEEVVPEVVHEKKLPFVGDETYKTVDYEKLVALLIESNKELTARVEQLEARLDGSTK